MKIFSAIVFLFILVLTRTGTAQEKPATKQENSVINLIAKLPEVVEFNRQMKKSNGRPLVITIDSDPTKNNPYYTIAVAEDMGDRLFTYWRFCVNSKTQAISYWDVIADKRIPLKTWRENGRKP